METSLHRDLKEIYATRGARVEAPLGKYRIDVVNGDQLIEIQHGSLCAIRDKVRILLRNHRLLVVKPIVARKRLVKLDANAGRVVSRRFSPKRGRDIDLFHELIYFTSVFPHRGLRLEVPLVDVEETRYPGRGRHRRRRGTYVVQDRKLVAVHGVTRFHSAVDLLQIVPGDLPDPFHTAHLAQRLNIERWEAQCITYCLRKTGAARQVGKDGNAWLYQCLPDSAHALG